MSMKKAIFKHVVLASAVAALMSGTAFAQITAKLGHAMPESHPQGKTAMNRFAELALKQ